MTDLLTIKDLKVDFKIQSGTIRAVNGISLRIRGGSTVALVGESGSGKSVTAQAIVDRVRASNAGAFSGADDATRDFLRGLFDDIRERELNLLQNLTLAEMVARLDEVRSRPPDGTAEPSTPAADNPEQKM